MSYALSVVGSASRRIKALPIEVQEAVFDFLERLALDATPAAPDREQHVVAYRSDVGEFHVHVGVENDHAARTVTCTWLWYVARLDDGT